jgi:FAD/FMN-containing dehydrogenase
MDISDIKDELIEAIGRENFRDDEDTLTAYSHDHSFENPCMPAAVVYPKGTAQVEGVMKLAYKARVPVTPRSSGAGFHGAGIPASGGLVVDMSRNNAIQKIDVRNRVVRIEPGVRWNQLQHALAGHEMRAINPLLPHKEKSVVSGNLERNPHVIFKYEYNEPDATMELVLPDGRLFRTGSAATPGAPDKTQAALINTYGPGSMDFQRLFHGAQGTMGIICWLNLRTEYLSEMQRVFFMPFEKVDALIEPLYRMGRRMIGNECFALDRNAMAWAMAKDFSRDSEPPVDAVPAWTMMSVIAGAPRNPGGKVAYQVDALKEHMGALGVKPSAELPGIDDAPETWLSRIRGAWEGEVYWKHLAKGSSRDLFFITTPDRVPEFVSMIEELLKSHGLPADEHGIYIQPIEYSRVVHLEFIFPVDPADDPEPLKRFFIQAGEKALKMGAFFSQPYGFLAKMVFEQASKYLPVLRRFHRLFDPREIMNPGVWVRPDIPR